MDNEHISGGFILLARKILESRLWRGMSLKTTNVALTCLLLANHQPRKWWVGGREIIIQRGQFFSSLPQLKSKCHRLVSLRTLRRSLTGLEAVGFLTGKSTNQGRLITICNYETYQDAKRYKGQTKGQAKGQASGQAKGRQVDRQGASNNNVNNGNAVKNVQTTTMARSDAGASSSHEIPDDLKDLELYEVDKKLCAAWPAFRKAQELACPGVDIVAATRRAHAWEIANPKKRKKLRTRFLSSWFAREQDKPGRSQGEGYDNTKQRRGEVGRVPTPPGARFRESEKIA